MDKLEIKEDWINIKGKLHQNWGSLTEDDLQFAAGREDELIRRIQKRTGATWKEVEQTIRGFVGDASQKKSAPKSGPPIL